MPKKRELLTLFLVVATELIGFGLIIPVLPQIANQFQANGVLLGILLAAYSAAQFVAGPILGSLSDKYGRKNILILSKLGTVFAYGLLAMANSYSLILISRLIDGLTGGNISVARAYVADVTTKENRSKGMAIIGISFGVGFVVGPGLGGLLYGPSGSHMLPAIVAGSFSLIALLCTIFLLKEPEKHNEAAADNFKLLAFISEIKAPAILVLLLVQLIYMVVFSGFETTFALFTAQSFGYTAKQNSLLFFYMGLFGLFIQGGLARRTVANPKPMIGAGIGLVAVGYGLLSQLQTATWLIPVLFVLAVGISLVMIYLPSYISTMAAEDKIGGVMGVYESIGSLARIIGPLVAYTAIFTNIANGYFWFGVMLLGVLGCLGFLRE